MKKKKGFTLIELLAIIVILAIIAVITIPILLNVIENARKGSAVDSAYGFKDSINKYYITKLSSDRQFQLEGEYTVTNGKLTGPNITDEDGVSIPISGTIPSSGSLTYSNNTLTEGCLVIGEYAVTFEDGSVTSTEKGECSMKVDFEHDSWSKIIANLSIDRHAYDDEIGKTKIIELDLNGNNTISDDEKFNVRIANTSDSVENGCREEVNGKEQHKEGFSETACGFVVEFVDIITTYQMNGTDYSTSTSVGGWPASEMRTFVNGTIYNALPTEVKNAIIPTTVVSGHGSTSGETNFTSTDKLYLLSTHEVWEDVDGNTSTGIDCDDTSYSLTRQLDYYKNNNVTTSSHALAIKKKSGSVNYWWLRSAPSNFNLTFYSVYSDGDNIRGYSCNTYYGVAPAFRLAD